MKHEIDTLRDRAGAIAEAGQNGRLNGLDKDMTYKLVGLIDAALRVVYAYKGVTYNDHGLTEAMARAGMPPLGE